MNAAIIGGDRRMLYAALGLCEAGLDVTVSGFDGEEIPEGLRQLPAEAAVLGADIIILPVRPPEGYAALYGALGALAGSRPVFSGAGESVQQYFSGRVYDYTKREDFCVKNAVLTAEGAIQLAISGHDDSIFGSDALVAGYGRIGRALARYLRALGARVTVAVRSAQAEAWAEAEGHDVCDYSFRELYKYDLIFNTVPAPVLPAAQTDRIKRSALVIDLASAPGGADIKRAGERGIKAMRAPGLPGKTAPAAAGRIIKDTIINIIKEENGGKDNLGLCDDRLLLHL